MKNFICDGERITLVATAAMNPGDIYLYGSKVCVVMNGGAIGDTVTLMNEGVFNVNKATVAFSAGQRIYWDATNSVFTTATSGNTFAGYAFGAALSTDTTANVLIVDNPGGYQAGTVAAIATADGSDAATTQALANATKATVNSILTALKTAGLMA